MSSPAQLLLPTTLGPTVAAEVRRYGQQGRETAGFLLAPRGTNRVSELACCAQTGIARHADLLRISASALERLFLYAQQRDLWIPAQVHSHRSRAFLSRVDAAFGFCLEDYVSCVVPHFTRPPGAADAWGWWRFRRGSWQAIACPALTTSSLEQVWFDEDGICAG